MFQSGNASFYFSPALIQIVIIKANYDPYIF